MSAIPPDVSGEMARLQAANEVSQSAADKLAQPEPARWHPTEETTPRFIELVKWLDSCGVCSMCCLCFSVATIEHEAGRRWSDGRSCTKTDRSGRTCRGLLEANWAMRPRRAGP